MKLENNWQYKTLENLEKVKWGMPNFDSFLVRRCHELRKIPLNTFTTEDLRIMIGQQIGLDYLIHLALETLKENLFAEGDFYEGDLLKNVLDVKTEFWNNNRQYWLTLHDLAKHRMGELAENKIDTANFYKSKHITLQ